MIAAVFTLEIFYERPEDQRFAEQAERRLCGLVKQLAPHIDLQVRIYMATNIKRCHFEYGGVERNVPYHDPIGNDSEALLITNENIGAQGWGGGRKGCVSKQGMDDKDQRGGDSAEITIHEWLHTISGKLINGKQIPNPDDSNRCGFPNASSRGPDGQDQWHDWYRYMLRE